MVLITIHGYYLLTICNFLKCRNNFCYNAFTKLASFSSSSSSLSSTVSSFPKAVVFSVDSRHTTSRNYSTVTCEVATFTGREITPLQACHLGQEILVSNSDRRDCIMETFVVVLFGGRGAE